MEINKKLPKSFFEKIRPEAPKDSLKDIVKFNFSDEKKIKKGEFKNQKIIKLADKK